MAQAEVRNLEVGEYFSPFEQFTRLPDNELESAIIHCLEDDDYHRLYRFPLSLQNIPGWIEAYSQTRGNLRGAETPLGKVDITLSLQDGVLRTEGPPVALEVGFNFGADTDEQEQIKFNTLRNLRLEIQAGNSIYYMNCAGTSPVIDNYSEIEDQEGHKVGVVYPYDKDRLAQIKMRFVEKAVLGPFDYFSGHI